jgi:hypothetical protein
VWHYKYRIQFNFYFQQENVLSQNSLELGNESYIHTTESHDNKNLNNSSNSILTKDIVDNSFSIEGNTENFKVYNHTTPHCYFSLTNVTQTISFNFVGIQQTNKDKFHFLAHSRRMQCIY